MKSRTKQLMRTIFSWPGYYRPVGVGNCLLALVLKSVFFEIALFCFILSAIIGFINNNTNNIVLICSGQHCNYFLYCAPIYGCPSAYLLLYLIYTYIYIFFLGTLIGQHLPFINYPMYTFNVSIYIQ